MIFRKYNPRKRDSILICMPDCEGTTIIKMDTEQQIRTTLESKYKESIIDSPPYNYVVYSGGYFELKPPDIAHTDNSYLAAYNNDIKILLLEREFLKTKKEEIVKIVSDISCRYSMSIQSSLMIMTLEETAETTSLMDSILKESIQLRNITKPIMSIKESVVGGEVISNENIVTYENRDGTSRLSSIASRFSIPLSTLKELNPHINPISVSISETIFLPATATIVSVRAANSAVKKATYLYDLCAHIVEKGLKIDG